MFGLVPFNRRNNSIIGKNDLNGFRSLVDDFFNDSFFAGFEALNPLRTDIRETQSEYMIEVEVPGSSKEDIKLDINDDVLTVSLEHKEDINDEKANYLRRERRYGSYQRSFKLTNIKNEDIKAQYNDGVLKILVPKKEIENKSTKKIEIQ